MNKEKCLSFFFNFCRKMTTYLRILYSFFYCTCSACTMIACFIAVFFPVTFVPCYADPYNLNMAHNTPHSIHHSTPTAQYSTSYHIPHHSTLTLHHNTHYHRTPHHTTHHIAIHQTTLHQTTLHHIT